MRTKRKALPLVLIAIGFCPLAHAFPIRPQPLRQLMVESDLIVAAKVENTRRLMLKKTPFLDAQAKLRIVSTAKGPAGRETIKVYYSISLACPNPAKYDEGTTVLAFLRFDEEIGGYRTCGLSYGAKPLAEPDRGVYMARIRELVDIQKETNRDARTSRTAEWLVRCVEHPATRWEGLFDLDGPPPTLSGDSPWSGYGLHQYLTDSHKARLLAVLEEIRRDPRGQARNAVLLISVLARSANSAELISLAEGFTEATSRNYGILGGEQRNRVGAFIEKYESLRESPSP